MKNLLSLILLTASLSIFSQVPSYYNDVNLNQSNTNLKDALATKIISTHTVNLSYSPGVWEALKQSDLDPTNNSKVVLIYGYNDFDQNYVTDKTRSKDANGGSIGTQWNREHVYPKSLGTPNLRTSGPGADIHHLRPADIYFNGQRSSKKFIKGAGNARSISSGWYPGDEWKGDVARMMMYMYIRYGNQCLPRNVAIGMTNSSDNNMINLLLEWNVEDPVSNFEKNRNNAIADLQGNRNPFIDNPAFATQIWGGPQAENLFDNNVRNNASSSSSELNTDLFISEYMEGSSNNKAVEIANFTGSTVNLSEYSLKKASNGKGWSSTLPLKGQLNNRKLYVIANSNAASTIRNKAQKTDDNILSFNGNDAIGLFKGKVLIDLIGNPNSSSIFAKDKTLQRKPAIKSPNTNYTTSEWSVLSKDTFSGLGNHRVNSIRASKNITPTFPENFIANFYPNPAHNFIKIKMASDRKANFKIINSIGQEVLKGQINNATIDISNLENGMYFLKINDNQKVFTKKFIKK